MGNRGPALRGAEAENQAGPPLRVCICIATYKRPRLLARTLNSLAGLSFPQNPGLDLKIIVVENDPEGLGFPAVQKARAELPWPVGYAVEERRGISFARNRLVALAQGCDFIAFIDDDEAAEPAWLDELVAVQGQTGAEAVLGPVEPVFEEAPPEWLRSFFSHWRFPTGRQVSSKVFRTCNALVSAAALARVDGPFDPAFALTGGEDAELGRRLEAGGARFFWADRAVVREYIPSSRARIPWLLRRKFRCGTTLALRDRRRYGPLGGGVLSLLRSAVYFLGGGAVLLSSLGLRPKALVRGLCLTSYGSGSLAGILGLKYEEYKTIHGN